MTIWRLWYLMAASSFPQETLSFRNGPPAVEKASPLGASKPALQGQANAATTPCPSLKAIDAATEIDGFVANLDMPQKGNF